MEDKKRDFKICCWGTCLSNQEINKELSYFVVLLYCMAHILSTLMPLWDWPTLAMFSMSYLWYFTIFRVHINALPYLNLWKPQGRQERYYTHILHMTKPKKKKWKWDNNSDFLPYNLVVLLSAVHWHIIFLYLIYCAFASGLYLYTSTHLNNLWKIKSVIYVFTIIRIFGIHT